MMDFNKLAQEFEERLRTTPITATTDVNLIHYAVDANSQPVPPFKTSLLPVTTVKFPGRPEREKEFAREAHLDAICGNMNAVVPHITGDQLMMIRKGPPHAVKIINFDLEIRDDAADLET